MEQEQYIKTYKKGQQLKLERRVRLEYLLKNKKKLKLTNEMIAKELNISTRTLYCNIVKYMDTIFKYIFMERQNYSCLSM